MTLYTVWQEGGFTCQRHKAITVCWFCLTNSIPMKFHHWAFQPHFTGGQQSVNVQPLLLSHVWDWPLSVTMVSRGTSDGRGCGALVFFRGPPFLLDKTRWGGGGQWQLVDALCSSRWTLPRGTFWAGQINPKWTGGKKELPVHCSSLCGLTWFVVTCVCLSPMQKEQRERGGMPVNESCSCTVSLIPCVGQAEWMGPRKGRRQRGIWGHWRV